MTATTPASGRRYRPSVQTGRWYFGFTLWRLSFFVAWKCDRTWWGYGGELLKLNDDREKVGQP